MKIYRLIYLICLSAVVIIYTYVAGRKPSERDSRDLRAKIVVVRIQRVPEHTADMGSVKSASCQWVILNFFRNAIAMGAMQWVVRYSSLAITSAGMVPFFIYFFLIATFRLHYVYIYTCGGSRRQLFPKFLV